MKKLFMPVLFLLILTSTYAKDYKYSFCITSPTGKYRVTAKVPVGGTVGKEIARQIVLNKVRPALQKPISISDCTNQCKHKEDFEVVAKNIDGKILKVALEDPSKLPGAIAESVASTIQNVKDIIKKPENIIKKPTKEAKKVIKKVKKVLKKIF